MAKIVPAQNRFVVSVPHGTAVNVDIAHCLSILNRRLYRQGMNYFVESVTVHSPGACVLGVASAPDTWITHNAWKKAFHLWRGQIQSLTARPDGGDGDHGPHYHGQGMSGIEGKWADFKVILDDGGESFITPVDGNSDAYLLGEWNYSNYFWDDDGTERSPGFHLIGGTNTASSIGIIEEYGRSRAMVGTEPIVDADASDSIYAKGLINDEILQDVVDAIESENDNPPYDNDDYPGGDANGDHPILQASMATTAEYPISSIGGFTAPCGLLQFQQAQASGTSAVLVFITIGIGPYKGIMASKMGQ